MKKALLLIAPLCAALAVIISQKPAPERVAEYSTRAAQSTTQGIADAQEFLRKLRANPETGEMDYELMARVEKAAQRFRANQADQRSALELTWHEMGPDNIGGRTRAVWADSDDEYWVGGVSGGVWHTTNAGNNWTQVYPFPHQVVSQICRAGDGTLYVGTGNTFESGGGGNGGSGFLGAGLFRSDDNGESWSIVEGTEPPLFSGGDGWAEINDVYPDPTNDNVVWLATRGGLVRYNGASGDLNNGPWDGLPNGTVQDIDMSVNGDVILIAAQSGASPLIYRSVDGGNSWTQESGTGGQDLPQSGRSRARVAVSTSDPNHCFVLYAASNGSMGGLYYSSNAGQDWEFAWAADTDLADFDPMGSNRQGYYDLALEIDPNDPTIAFVGGVTLWKSGPNYQPPEQIALNFAFPGSPLYVHSDIHEMTLTPGGRLLIGCDGGMHRSDNPNSIFPVFTQINRGYNITQYYNISQSSGTTVAGGTQDNGTHVIFGDDTFISPQEAIQAFGGDGFSVELSQVTEGDRNLIFATSQYGVTSRFDDSGTGGMYFDDELMELVNDEGRIGSDFFTTIRSFENTEDDASEQFVILINPGDSILADPDPADPNVHADVLLQTNNLDIPFFYTIDDILGDPDSPDYLGAEFSNEPLMYWDSVVREPFIVDEPYELTQDSMFWWLDPQDLDELIIECDLDTQVVGTEIVEEIIYEEECEYVELLDSLICIDIPVDTIETEVDILEITEICDTSYSYLGDVTYNVREHRLVQDRYTTFMSFGLDGGNGFWITREAFNLNVTPNWFKVVNNTGVGVKDIEYGSDGKTLYYSNYGSNVFRLTNIDQLWTEEDIDNLDLSSIRTAGGIVTGLDSDPNDPDHLVIAVGGYGDNSQGKIQETWNATAENPTWENIWLPNSEPLAAMPCYDVLIDNADPTGATIIAGTEFGIFTTDDGGETWVMANDPADPAQSTGINMTPVFELRQQTVGNKRFRNPTNYNVIYAGTHGRGIFSSRDMATSVEEFDDEVATEQSIINLYPNPGNGMLSLDVTMATLQDGLIEVYTADGRLVKSVNERNIPAGMQTLRFDFSDLSNGNYILRFEAGGRSAAKHFVVMK